MDRGLILFWAGMMLIIALFIPISVLQDSGPVHDREKRESKRCAAFAAPQTLVGDYKCHAKRKNGVDAAYLCRLVCPRTMKARPVKNRLRYQCSRGRWVLSRQDGAYCVAKRPVSLVEQQLADPKLLNNLLSSYLNHSNHYLAMAYFFDRADVQLPGFHQYFLKMWKTTLEQARTIMAYINKRGGWIDMAEQPRPGLMELLHMGQESGHVGLMAMQTAVTMERKSQSEILQLTEILEKPRNHDPHLQHTIEHEFLTHKVKILKELVDYVTQLKSFQQTGQDDYRLGEYELDTVLQHL